MPRDEQEQRQFKPSELSVALYGMDDVLAHLISLKETIEGAASNKEQGTAKTGAPTHPLAQLLEEGPGLVTSKCQKAHETINEIESLLF